MTSLHKHDTILQIYIRRKNYKGENIMTKEIQDMLEESFKHRRFINLRIKGQKFNGVVWELPSPKWGDAGIAVLKDRISDSRGNRLCFRLGDVEDAFCDW